MLYYSQRIEDYQQKRSMVMLFDERMVVDAQKFALNAKASIQRNGRLGFTGEAAKLLGLQEGLTMLFSAMQSGDLAAVICDASESRGFRIQRAGDYYYIRMKNFFDSQNLDYIKRRVSYDISETPERYQDKVVYKFTRGIYERRTSGDSEPEDIEQNDVLSQS